MKVNENKSSVIKKILSVIAAVAVTAAVFFAGFYTRKLTQPSYISVYEWAVGTIKKHYYYDFDAKACEGLSLKEIGARLDRYSGFYTAEEYKAVIKENEGAKSGLGITYSFVPDEGARIISVMGNSPAYLCGIRAGDTIIGGKAGDGAEVGVEFMTAQSFSEFIDGRDTGEKFTLTAKAENGKEEESFTVSKEFYTAGYTFYATKETAWEVRYAEKSSSPTLFEAPADKIEYLPAGFGYIRLNQFYGNAGDEFGRLAEKFNADGCTSLILDLRNNGGGYVSVMQDIAGYFHAATSESSGVAMTAEYKNGRKETYKAYRHTGAGVVSADTTVYVLANSGTASASEALIGVLVSCGALEYKNIFLSDYSEEYLGFAGADAKTAQSYGKGIMQTTFVKPFTKEALKLTTAQIYWPNGKCIHDVGLTVKDGCRPSRAEWTATKGDTELQNICTEYLGK